MKSKYFKKSLKSNYSVFSVSLKSLMRNYFFLNIKLINAPQRTQSRNGIWLSDTCIWNVTLLCIYLRWRYFFWRSWWPISHFIYVGRFLHNCHHYLGSCIFMQTYWLHGLHLLHRQPPQYSWTSSLHFLLQLILLCPSHCSTL